MHPPIEPFQVEWLRVSERHKIYLEQSGNPEGVPVLFLHGGPGAGTHAGQRCYFDPKFYRIILFDQRGCGQSLPFAELEENTTWDLVSDIEKIRIHLGVESFVLFGGSWGSTLALAYGMSHPDRVRALVLRGIFLLRKEEIDWLYQSGTSRLFPDEWEKYRDHIPPSERHDFLDAYYRRLTSENNETKLGAARIWSQWEKATSFLRYNQAAIQLMDAAENALPFARIEAHYFKHAGFFKNDNYLLDNAYRLKGSSMWIVHGRYDVVCPLENAWLLKEKLPQANLTIIPDAGHSESEPGIRQRLFEIMQELIRII